MERNKTLDFYRALGLICIFLAHSMPMPIIMQIRDFDVPLMVFISGLVAPRVIVSLKNYYIHRTARLLIPTYLFLVFLFSLYCLLFKVGVIPKMANFSSVVLNTFLLLENESIGFVWVVRVFLLMMLITPIFLKARLDCISKYIIVLLAFIFCSILLQLSYDIVVLPHSIDIVYVEYLQYVFGYGIVYIVALRYNYSKKKERNITLIFGFLAFLICAFYYYLRFGLPIEFYLYFKYPPTVPYLSYGILICLILMGIQKYIPLKIVSNPSVAFIGKNTFWLYLWHIPFALNVNEFISEWWLKWMVLIIAPLIIYTFQYWFVKKYLSSKTFSKYLIG